MGNQLMGWAQVDQELADTARALGVGSPNDAWIAQALDELGPWAPTEAEALQLAPEEEAAP